MPATSHSTASPAFDAAQPVHRRVVAVQGAVQLTSALAAMRLSDARRERRLVENHLIVHDLSSPADQAGDFADCLKGLAEQASDWASLHYFPLSEMLRLQEPLKMGNWEQATAMLRETLRFDRADELLLGQNLLFINGLLHRSFPMAETACYGDGIGLNFTSDYYRPASNSIPSLSLGKSIERWIRRRIKRLRGVPDPPPEIGKSKKHAVAFEKHYLLLPNQFDQQLDRYEKLDEDDFRELFSVFARNLDQRAPETDAKLNAGLKGASQVIVLLTSNFSETKRMGQEGEVRCYMEMVCRERKSDSAILVIKPHPRDSIEKIRQLETHAAPFFRRVITLADPWTFFVPFESIFTRYFLSDPSIAGKTCVLCSSSACISLEYLYGQRCALGFGPRNVRRYFDAKWQALRQRHESDLLRVVENVRQMQASRRAA